MNPWKYVSILNISLREVLLNRTPQVQEQSLHNTGHTPRYGFVYSLIYKDYSGMLNCGQHFPQGKKPVWVSLIKDKSVKLSYLQPHEHKEKPRYCTPYFSACELGVTFHPLYRCQGQSKRL